MRAIPPSGKRDSHYDSHKGCRKADKIHTRESPITGVFMSMRLHICLLVALTALAQAGAEEPSKSSYYDPDTFFRTQIEPILSKRCYECHSKAQDADDGGLVLDSKEGWMTGGDHGPAVTPKNLKKSPLIRTIKSHDSGNLMPPDERLPPIEIALLETWVLLGAPDPRTTAEAK